MLPTIRRNQSWLPDIFNDFFDNSWMERANYTAPAINVIENEIVENGVTHKKELVKILGRGELTAKVEVRAHAFSAKAKEMIEAVGGTCDKYETK